MSICMAHMHTIEKVGVGLSRPVSSAVSQKMTTERVLAEIDRLAPLPAVVTDVLRVAEEPRATFRDLEQIICRDVILMGRVFKLANSAFYARGEPLKTIAEAVRRLGFSTIKMLVIAAGAGKALIHALQHYAYSSFGFWQHSLGLALLARSLARYLRFPLHQQDELFLAGLMHDIGKLVLDPILGDAEYGPGWLTPERELTAVGIDHSEVGGRVAKKWKLPDYVVAVIEHHHTLSTCTDFAQHAALIHLGDYLINEARVGLAARVQVEEDVDLTALDILGLEAQTIDALRQVVSDALPGIIGLCEELGPC